MGIIKTKPVRSQKEILWVSCQRRVESEEYHHDDQPVNQDAAGIFCVGEQRPFSLTFGGSFINPCQPIVFQSSKFNVS